MAQVESSEPVVAASPPAAVPDQAQAVAQAVESSVLEEAAPAIEQLGPQESVLKKEEGAEETAASGDDDVQFVFSATIPRKKKKRLDSVNPTVAADQNVELPSKTEPRSESMASNEAPLTTTAPAAPLPATPQPGAVQKSNTYQYPLIQNITPTDVGGHQALWVPDPTFGAQQTSFFPPFQSSLPYWNESVPTTNGPNQAWNPMGIGDGISRKRPWVGEDFDGRPNSRDSTQISPITNPASMPAPLGHVYSGMGYGSLESFRRPDQAPQMPWMNLNWNAIDIGASQYGPPPSFNPNIRPEMISPARQWHANMQQPLLYRQPPPQVSNWIQQPESIPRDPNHNPPLQLPHNFQLAQVQTQNCGMQLPSRESPLPQLGLPQGRPLQTLPAPQRQLSFPGVAPTQQVPSIDNSQLTVQSTVSQPRARNVQPADITRKPSLYSVPVWPAAPSSSPVRPPMGPVQNKSVVNNARPDNGGASHGTSSEASISQPSQMQNSNGVAQSSPPSNPAVNATPYTAASSQGPRDGQRSEKDGSTVTKARGGRKHSPNLIVDIAETAQEVFPFSTVAARHGIPIQRVLDTFSAIVQLPLLRHADDRRRHGELGKKRMREYKDAKKAMEKAQEVESKERLRKVREERARQEKAAADKEVAAGNASLADALRRRAVLNNASHGRGGNSAS